MAPLSKRGYPDGVVAAVALFAIFAADMRLAQPGQAYFAHTLLPHFPYALAPDCRLKPVSRWTNRTKAWDSDAPRSVREDAYYDRLQCTSSKVSALVDAVSRSPAADDCVLIVHGDHGSRVTDVKPQLSNLHKIIPRDIVSGYSTLFAIRAPRFPPGYDAVPRPAGALVRELARSNFRSVGGPESERRVPTAYFGDENWIPSRRVPRPKSWLSVP